MQGKQSARKRRNIQMRPMSRIKSKGIQQSFISDTSVSTPLKTDHVNAVQQPVNPAVPKPSPVKTTPTPATIPNPINQPPPPSPATPITPPTPVIPSGQRENPSYPASSNSSAQKQSPKSPTDSPTSSKYCTPTSAQTPFFDPRVKSQGIFYRDYPL
jgi:hypothetical protein